MPSQGTAQTLRRVGAVLLLVIAGVHFQQYVDFMSLVPTVGVLFLLNAAGGAALLLALLSGERLIRTLAMLGSIALAAGSLVSIAIALEDSFFGYEEPTLRLPILIAIVSEVLLIGVLALPLVRGIRRA
jgi:hypothetical protein